MRLTPAILIGKLIAQISRLLKVGGGSAAPGLYALKVDPDIVSKLSKEIPKNIVITGTNGKTTTSRMLAHFAKEAGLRVIRNHTGSNLERGIASALISNYTLYPIPYLRGAEASSAYTLDLGIWELDEAAFNSVAPKLHPSLIIFLNVFRDQLDRYGEVDSVIKNWIQTLKKLSPDTALLINGDDANLLELKKHFKGKIHLFSVDKFKIEGEKKTSLKIVPNFQATNIKFRGMETSFAYILHDCEIPIKLPLPGIYNIYNAVAAMSAFYLGFGLGDNQAKSLKNFNSAFGRAEKLPFGYMMLIKNPTGATQVFQTIAPQIKKGDRLLLALNDNLADGTDVSWIWDTDFERLLTPSLRAQRSNLFVSGTRAYDLAVRLKYAGFSPKQIRIEPGLEKALREARKGLRGKLFILPTYTAMLQLQRILVKIRVKEDYWNE